ncbi:hypothetical protein KC19_2G055300 [Ceratodon purpureus]|uniref:Uncharacterized protein n=1 Tax=Ceratodon purpureus TaxID=3225 RepID=A0A8T0ITK9_CERPU|nr:hypothetical protein KC19_2G055300 [Ceratodon purpureus]
MLDTRDRVSMYIRELSGHLTILYFMDFTVQKEWTTRLFGSPFSCSLPSSRWERVYVIAQSSILKVCIFCVLSSFDSLGRAGCLNACSQHATVSFFLLHFLQLHIWLLAPKVCYDCRVSQIMV